MNYYVISYDLMNAHKNYLAVFKAIQSVSSDWIKPLKSFFVIQSLYSADLVAQEITKSLDSDDRLFVVECDIHTWRALHIETSDVTKLYDWRD